MLTPIQFIKWAIKAVPSVRYAVGVGGMIGVVAIISSFRLDTRAQVYGLIGLVLAMVLLAIFANLVQLAAGRFVLPGLVLIWFVLIVFMAAVLTLFSAITIGKPKIDLSPLIFPSPAPKPPSAASVSGTDLVDGTQVPVQYNFDGQTREDAIGQMYEYGRGIAEDSAKAAEWFQKGISRNDAESMVNYGELLRRGALGPRDDKVDQMSSELFLHAAKLGNKRGLFRAGIIYQKEKDYKKAFDFYKSSADKGFDMAYAAIGDLFADGLLGDDRKPEAIAWLEKGVANGSISAKHHLAVELFEGGSGTKDRKRSVQLLEEVVQNTDYWDRDSALWALGDYYSRPGSEVYDLVRAKMILNQDASRGHPCSRSRLAEILLRESPPKTNDAIQLLEAGVKDQQASPLFYYSKFLLEGKLLPKNTVRAESLLKSCSASPVNESDCMLLLAKSYQSGDFGKPDSLAAAKYYSLAAEYGSKDAEDRLKILFSRPIACSA